MSAVIGNAKDKNGNTFYPITKTNAVLDNNNVDVETRLSNLDSKTKYMNDFMTLKMTSNFTFPDTSDNQIPNLQVVFSKITDNSLVFNSSNNSITVSADVTAVEIYAYLYIAQNTGTTAAYAVRYSNAIKLNGKDFGFNTGTTSNAISYISTMSGSREQYVEVVNSIMVDLKTAGNQSSNIITFVSKASGTTSTSPVIQSASTKFMIRVLY